MKVVAPLSTQDLVGDGTTVENLFLRLYTLLPELPQESKAKSDSKRQILRSLESAGTTVFGRSDRVLEQLVQRQGDMIRDLTAQGLRPCKPVVLKLSHNFTCGMANGNALENGMTLLRPYGVPIVPGAAVKGTVGAWLGEILEGKLAIDAEIQIEKLRASGLLNLFGWGEKDEGESGNVVFFDALPRVASLEVDITTVHHQSWYEGTGTPAGFQNPVPIPFLSVKSASEFQFCFALQESAHLPAEDICRALKPAFDPFGIDGWLDPETFLRQALISTGRYKGFGSQTAAGFGKMEPA